MKTFATMIQKGGVGKTTVAINLAAALAELERGSDGVARQLASGAQPERRWVKDADDPIPDSERSAEIIDLLQAGPLRVLVIDLDPQGHATEGLGLASTYDNSGPTLASELLGETTVGLRSIIVPGDDVDVIPSSPDMFLIETRMASMRGRESRLARLLEPLRDDYDMVLIDCPSAIGVLTDNALLATIGDRSGGVLIVMQAQDSSLRAVELLMDQIDSVGEGLSVHVPVVGIVINQIEDTGVARQTIAAVEALDGVRVLARIRKRVRLQEAWREGRSILRLDPNGHPADEFRKLASVIANDGATIDAGVGAES